MIEKIALNMVVYNEAHRIAETLEKVRPYVDLIAIVDQSSTDGTYEICDNYADELVRDRHWGYCEPSRQLCSALTPDDHWILVLDADEHISKRFASDMRTLDEDGYRGAMMKRSFWLNGEHRFTGDYQYRFFRHDSVIFYNHLHTDPRPFGISTSEFWFTPYVAIWHTKSWTEQIRDELAYEQLCEDVPEGYEMARERWLELNVHLALLREKGINPEEADKIDKMELEELEEYGMNALDKNFEGNPWEE